MKKHLFTICTLTNLYVAIKFTLITMSTQATPLSCFIAITYLLIGLSGILVFLTERGVAKHGQDN